MALITPGPMIGEASGRVGGTIFSHNRGGMYVRNGVVPTKVTSLYTEEVRGVLSVCSRAWGALSRDDQEAWHTYCVESPVVNRLGQKKTLAGHMAYNAINARLLQSGDPAIDIPPNGAAPDAFASVAVTADLSSTEANVVFTPTPLGANIRGWIWAAVSTKPGVGYVGNKWRLVHKSAKALASPVDIWDDLVARFGTLQVDDVVFVRCQTLDSTTGLVSGFTSGFCTVQA